MTTYICEACDTECDVIDQEEGGWEEIWGARVFHSMIVSVSYCCLDNFKEVNDDGTDL